MRNTWRPTASIMAVLTALVASLLVSACASKPVRTADETKEWQRCAGSWPENFSYVCFRR